jgi:hypothetical protein
MNYIDFMSSPRPKGTFTLHVRTSNVHMLTLWRTASLRSAPHQQTPEPVYIVVDKLVHCDPNMYS